MSNSDEFICNGAMKCLYYDKKILWFLPGLVAPLGLLIVGPIEQTIRQSVQQDN